MFEGVTWGVFLSAIVFSAALAIVNARIAREKGRSVSAVLTLSLLVSPVLVWLYLVAVPSKKSTLPLQAPWEVRFWTGSYVHFDGPAVLRVAGAQVVPMAATKEADESLTTAIRCRNSADLTALERAGQIWMVDKDTACSVVNRGIDVSRVTVLAGPRRGQIGIVPTHFLSPQPKETQIEPLPKAQI